MYLSELFLQNLSDDFSETNLCKSFEVCEEEWEKRLQQCKDNNWKCEWQELYTELSDAWDVMKDFLRENDDNNSLLIILRCIGNARNAANEIAATLRNLTAGFPR